jgi:uncharacterized membrane protein
MDLKNLIFSYIFTLLVFFIVDMLWLGVIAKNIYGQQLGSFLRKDVNWAAAFIFYFIFVAGICYFCILPAVDGGTILKALISGSIFGLITYSTYDLTNLATIKGWPLKITLIDISWGVALSTMVSAAGYYIFRTIGG